MLALHTAVTTSAKVKIAGDDESESDAVVYSMSDDVPCDKVWRATLSSLSRPADGEGSLHGMVDALGVSTNKVSIAAAMPIR